MIDGGASDPRILTTKETAELIKASEAYVIRGVNSGLIPASRIGSEWRYWKPLVLTRVLSTSDITQGDSSVTEPDVVTASELAQLLGMTPHTVSKRIADGSIPARKVGKGWRCHWPTIRSVLEQGQDFTPR